MTTTPDTLGLYKQVTELSSAIAESEREASLLFADLVGSTAFKAVHGPVVGLQKTFLHNSIVTATVRGRGEVVKYIGDEVMIVFRGATHAAAACAVAHDIMRTLSDLSSAHPTDVRFPIEAKIGLHCGPLQYWSYPGHEQPDPQGTTVDVAARVVSLAKPQQILCSTAILRSSALPLTTFGAVVERHVKGIRDALGLAELLWDGTPRGVGRTAAVSTNDPEVERMLRDAQVHLDGRRQDAALQAYRTAHQRAPGDFNVNFRLGELLARGLGRVPEARTFLDTAREINPASPRLHLVEGFLAWQRKDCDSAIASTEESLRLADQALDYHSVRLAQGNLGYYLAERGAEGDLERALLLCEQAMSRYEAIQSRERSGFLDTYAFALLKRGTRDDLIKARQLLGEAIKCDSLNPYPHEHMSEVIRKERDQGAGTSRGWQY